MKGRVKWWDSKNGVGFIEYQDESNIFIHFDVKDEQLKKIKENQLIQFELDVTKKGLFLKKIDLF